MTANNLIQIASLDDLPNRLEEYYHMGYYKTEQDMRDVITERYPESTIYWWITDSKEYPCHSAGARRINAPGAAQGAIEL